MLIFAYVNNAVMIAVLLFKYDVIYLFYCQRNQFLKLCLHIAIDSSFAHRSVSLLFFFCNFYSFMF